jgi:hypothetical protein
MPADYYCSTCNSHLLHHQLRLVNKVIEVCPVCEKVLSEKKAFQMKPQPSGFERDLAAIDGWLGEECAANASACRRFQDTVVSDLYLWSITGDLLKSVPQQWSIEANYSREVPRIVSVKTIAAEQDLMSNERKEKIARSITSQGLQPHGLTWRSGSWTVAKDKPHLTRWGVKQYLATSHLSRGLLPAVTSRLFAVMQAALEATEGTSKSRSRAEPVQR